METKRSLILGGVAFVLFAVLAWNWISNWGLITVRADGMPLSKVIRSIERQGGVTVVTNLDPATPVTVEIYKATVPDALETLAIRLDASWSLGYAVGATRQDRDAAVVALAAGRRAEGHRRFSYPMGMFGFASDVIPDPRKISWNVTAMPEARDLHSYLDQFAQKTGAAVTVAEGWNPDLRATPKSGPAKSAVRGAAKSAGGDAVEVFLLTGSPWRGGGQFAGGGPGGPPSSSGDRDSAESRSGGPSGPPQSSTESRQPRTAGGGPPDGGWRDRPEPNPQWVAERVEAEIAQLPPDERQQARDDFAMMRDFFEQVRELPEEQRRVKVGEFFDNPVVQDRMEEREARRDARRSVEQRTERARRYIERKAAHKSS